MSLKMLSCFRRPALAPGEASKLLSKIRRLAPSVTGLETEWRYYVEVESDFKPGDEDVWLWLASETFEPNSFSSQSLIEQSDQTIIEVGPRKSLVPPWSSTALLVCHNFGMANISRLALARRYCLVGFAETSEVLVKVSALLFDRMTEEVYSEPLLTFASDVVAPPVELVPVLTEGVLALKAFCQKHGLPLDAQLIDYIVSEYQRIQRNPTDIEVYMIGQLWSNHCRHRDFNAKVIIDGQEMPYTLFDLIRQTCQQNKGPVAVAFSDNAAILKPQGVNDLLPSFPTAPSSYLPTTVRRGLAFKAETHNHPSAISPFEGEGTGLAVVRDIMGSGRGGVPTAYFAMNYVGNLFVPGYTLPWEQVLRTHPKRLATPLDIIIEGSNGGAAHANCLGIPLIAGGFTSFEQLVGGVHYGWIKTCVLAGCAGYVYASHTTKNHPQKGMLVVQIGGPAFRIGLGGGSGSSQNLGDQAVDLDFNSVQRPDPEEEAKNRDVIRVCVEMGLDNPIEALTDLGAGGDSVAVTELVYPAGAKIFLDKLPCGDPTMAEYVLWANEAQERMVMLISPENYKQFERICQRFRCRVAVIGEITGDGQLTLVQRNGQKIPISMSFLLRDLPQLEIKAETVIRPIAPPFKVDDTKSILQLLRETQAVPKVASKEFLTNKGDMTVTGKIVRNQIVGSANLPLADCAVVADSLSVTTGLAFAIGEQPICGLVNNAAAIRLSITEALLNLVSARVNLRDVSFSGTWQWPCYQSGEDQRLYEAVRVAGEFCRQLGLRIPVGKDSLSMTVKDSEGDIRAPGTLQAVAFAPCLDVTKTLTPDIKAPGRSQLMLVDLSFGKRRLGGSAFLQTKGQVGHITPDIDDPQRVINLFEAIQKLNASGLILSLHDISDGGLIQCLLEMAYAGNCGLTINLAGNKHSGITAIDDLFAQEPGVVFEYLPENENLIRQILSNFRLTKLSSSIGQTVFGPDAQIVIGWNGQNVLTEKMELLRAWWRDTSFQLDAIQGNPQTVQAERNNTYSLPEQAFALSFTPKPTKRTYFQVPEKPKVAVLQEEGTNGQRELADAFYRAGFDPLEVHMTDWLSGAFSLKQVRGLALPGGFAFRDVFDAGKAMAGLAKFNQRLADDLAAFVADPKTFGFGPCNGCQTMALLGLVPWQGIASCDQPRFIRNASTRFESRPVMLKIENSPSLFFRDMAGSILPIWVAHGQGYCHFPNQEILAKVLTDNLAPVRYVDRQGDITEEYPFNPNGSPNGIAGLCTPDGRFLAMMPHPERNCRRPGEQALYYPPTMMNLKASPWLRMFQNAYEWCRAN